MKETILRPGEITEKIPDPFWSSGKNINGTRPFFFHGTTKEALQNIKKFGFVTPVLRPTFTLNPVYSLAYCRKSESYLRGLIGRGTDKQLEEEVEDLISKGVISRNDLKDETYQWWIGKADKYYQKTFDVTKTGVLLVFDLPLADLVTPEVARIYIKRTGGKKAIFGAPSIWRTRQFGLKGTAGQIINLAKHKQTHISLNRKFVKTLKALYGSVKKGTLDKGVWNLATAALGQGVGVEEFNKIGIDKEFFVQSLASQVVDSVLIRALRENFIAAVCLGDLKVLWGKGVEDDRWYKSKEEIETALKQLESNQFPDKCWKEYLTENATKIRGLCEQ